MEKGIPIVIERIESGGYIISARDGKDRAYWGTKKRLLAAIDKHFSEPRRKPEIDMVSLAHQAAGIEPKEQENE